LSAIFGILGRDGRPVPGEHLNLMLRAHSHLPADASALWLDNEIGFGIIRRYHTPESPHEVFPQYSNCGRHAMVSHARLDNREELFRQLEVPNYLKTVTPDTALMAMAFERWGDATVEHLAGEWAFAVWSQESRRLFLALAPTGNGALFYNDEGPYFAFSSTPHGLLALPWVSKTPDLKALGFFLTGAMEKVSGSGLLMGIRALPPAHFLTVVHGRVETRAYWRPAEIAPLELRDDGEYIEAFLEQYRRAVTCCLRSYHGIGATLSGGLDSGSVVALAAENLQREGRTLSTFSAVPRFGLDDCASAGRSGDETPYILATAKAAGNVEVNLMRSEVISPVAGITAAIEACAAPVLGAVNCFWMHDILTQAQQRNLRVLLTGQGGNGTVSWSGSRYFPDYLDVSSVDRALRSLTRFFAGQGINKGFRMLLRGLLPVPSILTLKRFRGRPSPSKQFMNYSPLRSDFAASLDLNEYFDVMDTLILRGSKRVRQILIESASRFSGRFWYLSGAAHGVDVRDPTMDKELIEFLLSLPEEQYKRNSEERGLIRRAMAGLLPQEVAYSRERGLQGADIIHRIKESADEVFEELAGLEQCPPAREILDLGSMRNVALRTLNEISPDLTMLCGSVLCRGLSAGLFLKRYC
jgi:asparagine synthase (glutamine-hydrolysing)